jgi:Na+-driven multidrug efflux pump
MIVLAGLILGIITGVLTARKHGGKPLDMAQYAAGYGIAFTLIGVFITIIIDRMI